MPDRLDHFNRDRLVELTGQLAIEIAIVLEQHRDALRQSLLSDLLERVVMLRARNSRGCHAASVVLRRMNRKATPSGAYLQQMIVRAKIELAADAIDFGKSRFFEGRVRTGKNRARVHQGAIEDQLEELVAEIIMRRDIALTARPGVAIEVVQEAADRIRKPREAAVHALHHVAIADHYLDQRGQIVGGPGAGHVSLARAHAAAEREVRVETMVQHSNRRVQIGVGDFLPNRDALCAVFDHDAPLLDALESREHCASSKPLDYRRATRPCRIDARRDD